MEQKCKLFSHRLTQPLLCLYAWENIQKSQMNTCPEDVQFRISAETFLLKFNAVCCSLVRKVSVNQTLSHGSTVNAESGKEAESDSVTVPTG